MKLTHLTLLAVLALVAGGCYWISGPWTSPDRIRARYDKIEVGSLQSEVEDTLGKPSEIIYPEGGREAGSKAAWLLFKYDYPEDPLLISVKVDHFGIVTEKHLDDRQTVAEKAAETPRTADQQAYPGAPQARFQELLKQKNRGRSTQY